LIINNLFYNFIVNVGYSIRFYLEIYYFILTGIVKFENSFLNAGGIHEPKKIDCWCSDGILRSLLLKVDIYIRSRYKYLFICFQKIFETQKCIIMFQGNEDMHQDAIMQQVFVLMNRLLNSNKSTAKRKLAIRTYKVLYNITFIKTFFLTFLIYR